MTLPTSRNRTYAPGDLVRSADQNDFQDQIIRHENRLKQTRSRSGGGFIYGTGVVVDDQGRLELNALADGAMYDLDAPVGWRLTAVRVRCKDNATGSTRVQGEELGRQASGGLADISGTPVFESAGNGTEQGDDVSEA
jgi:hypothetical protein